MGGGVTSSASLSHMRAASKAANPTSAGFAYSSTASTVHDSMDPAKKNAAGKKVRESLASADSPNPIPIAVYADVTGSMQRQPVIAADNLPGLYALIKEKGYVANPHILFGAVGDAHGDNAPLQVGQFEADARVLDWLQKIFMEGGGGGGTGSLHSHESYDLMMYYMAHYTDLDCNKYGKKGYLFLCADERPYPVLKKSVIKDVIGDDVEQDVKFEDILKAVQKKFNFFYILPKAANHGNDPFVIDFWKDKLGENFVMVEDLSDLSNIIAGLVGMCEGVDFEDVVEDITLLGGKAAGESASTALAAYAGKTAVVKTGSASLPKTTSKVVETL
jgi:hypothetical protein